MADYRIGQRVEGVVESVFPFGVFVRLSDKTTAYIRRRDLDLDADVEPADVVSEGDRISGVVINLGDSHKHLELSRRATMCDYWEEFAHRYHEGSVATGVVQSLNSRGVFIRLLPGLNGFVPLEELATWHVSRPEELFWVDDEVEAIITRISPIKKKVWLSIKARLEQRAKALSIFDRMNSAPDDSSQRKAEASVEVEEYSEQIDQSLYYDVGPVLVVDDHAEVRIPLAAWLNQCGLEVSQAESLSEGLAQIHQKDWRVILIDLNLLECDGMELVRFAREQGSHAHICIMSSHDSLTERTTDIERAGVSQVFAKPLDVNELEQFLLRLARGESVPQWRAATQPAASVFPSFPGIATIERKEDAPLHRLQIALAQVTDTLRAQVGLIFGMDPSSRAISVLAQAGDDALKADAFYGLCDSPVEDAICEDAPIFENRVSEKAQARFSKLSDLLKFESCIGVPIRVHEEVHHAAFFFHSDPDAFSKYRVRDARAGALLFAAMLAEEAINRRLRSLHPMLLGGELAAGFGHEVANKISGLELQLLQLPIHGDRDELQSELASVLNLMLDLKSTVEAFQQLPRTNEEQMAVDLCDVNATTQRAELLLRPVARREGVKISQKLAPNLPPVAGSAITLQQVFLNVMLNAVQQMSLRPAEHRVLAISSSAGKEPFPIQVRFWDTGPGIHKPLWEKIFAPGFSTRNGSGLGLFIARNFLNSLGGRIRVEESFIPLGTTFLVELPGAESGGD
jgi:signal transduction histidine kinase/predicted RNA-binding protein with RPS1 domain